MVLLVLGEQELALFVILGDRDDTRLIGELRHLTQVVVFVETESAVGVDYLSGTPTGAG